MPIKLISWLFAKHSQTYTHTHTHTTELKKISKKSWHRAALTVPLAKLIKLIVTVQAVNCCVYVFLRTATFRLPNANKDVSCSSDQSRPIAVSLSLFSFLQFIWLHYQSRMPALHNSRGKSEAMLLRDFWAHVCRISSISNKILALF